MTSRKNAASDRAVLVPHSDEINSELANTNQFSPRLGVEDASDEYTFTASPQRAFASYNRIHIVVCMSVFAIVTSVMTVSYVMIRYNQLWEALHPLESRFRDRAISRIAFGSCLQIGIREQPVWRSVISVEPDAWIWIGDFAYLTSDPYCTAADCPCGEGPIPSYDWNCRSGDIVFAQNIYFQQLEQKEYRMFLDYMCPDAMLDNPSIPDRRCSRPIIGTWDDHDYGWNNGDKRLPRKLEYKQLFLDAIGEPSESPRRSSTRGVEDHYVFNRGDKYKEISVFLLDLRYYRDPQDCRVYWDKCQEVLKTDTPARPPSTIKTFCREFVKRGQGCCFKDTFFFHPTDGWCVEHAKVSPPPKYYEELCDPTNSDFGSRFWNINEQGRSVELGGHEGSFCDLLGPAQRRWLSDKLSKTKSRVNIVASSVVLAQDPTKCVNEAEEDYADSWDCFKAAQKNLISTLIRSDASCLVIIAGDLHYGDIKVLEPGVDKTYAETYGTEKLKYPIYQVVASGMTEGMNGPVDWRFSDPAGMRPPAVSATVSPHFGSISFDWEKERMSLQVLSAKDASVLAEATVDLRECSIARPK